MKFKLTQTEIWTNSTTNLNEFNKKFGKNNTVCLITTISSFWLTSNLWCRPLWDWYSMLLYYKSKLMNMELYFVKAIGHFIGRHVHGQVFAQDTIWKINCADHLLLCLHTNCTVQIDTHHGNVTHYVHGRKKSWYLCSTQKWHSRWLGD